jgi:hypothetical protein
MRFAPDAALRHYTSGSTPGLHPPAEGRARRVDISSHRYERACREASCPGRGAQCREPAPRAASAVITVPGSRVSGASRLRPGHATSVMAGTGPGTTSRHQQPSALPQSPPYPLLVTRPACPPARGRDRACGPTMPRAFGAHNFRDRLTTETRPKRERATRRRAARRFRRHPSRLPSRPRWCSPDAPATRPPAEPPAAPRPSRPAPSHAPRG